MIDCTKIPPHWVYKWRDDIDEFNVTPLANTINSQLYYALLRQDVVRCNGDKLVWCFNMAYYLTTLVLLDKHPELNLSGYLRMAYPEWGTMSDPFRAMVFGMVLTYLKSIDAKKWNGKNNIFTYNLSDLLFKDGKTSKYIAQLSIEVPNAPKMTEADFMPRSINDLLRDKHLTYFSQPFDNEKEIEGIESYLQLLCKNDEERRLLLNKVIKEVKELNGDIAFIGEFDVFMYSLEDKLKELEKHQPLTTEHQAPALAQPSENVQLQACNKELMARNDELVACNSKLEAKLKEAEEKNTQMEAELAELHQPFEDLTAMQKVRMELALQFMVKAGMPKEILEIKTKKCDGRKQAAAELMSLLLEIESNNNAKGNKAKTCATYISARDMSYTRHKDIIGKVDERLKQLDIDIHLGPTESESNKNLGEKPQ